MPSIRQYAERYAVEDFWKEIDRCCPLAGIHNASALGKRIGEGYQNLLNYQKGKTEMRVSVLRKLVTTLHPNPAVILKTLGYSDKEIRAFAREWQ